MIKTALNMRDLNLPIIKTNSLRLWRLEKIELIKFDSKKNHIKGLKSRNQ